MFTRLFGETYDIQLHNLHKKVVTTGAGIILCILGFLLELFRLESVSEVVLGAGGITLWVALFIWGFGAIKSLLRIGTIGALFSRNIVFGLVIFLFCVMLAYLISLFVTFLGIGRYIYLRVKISQEGR